MKRIFVSLLSLILIFTFSSCTSQARPDIITFSKRLSAVNEHYGFDYFDLFIYENIYHTYLSLCEENDVMLSFQLSQNNNIENITVTVFSDMVKTENAKNEISKFFSTCIDSFALLSEKEKQEKDENLSYNDTSLYFTDLYETYSVLRNNIIFSSNPVYMCLYCEYSESVSLN